MEPRRIAVIGAGIGGLTLAIALRRHGIDVAIYEQTPELREVGAAVALSANATRFFEQFGLGPQLAARSAEVSALVYRDGRTAASLASTRWGRPTASASGRRTSGFIAPTSRRSCPRRSGSIASCCASA